MSDVKAEGKDYKGRSGKSGGKTYAKKGNARKHAQKKGGKTYGKTYAKKGNGRGREAAQEEPKKAAKELPPKAYLPKGSLAERQYIGQLIKDIQNVDGDFVKFIQKNADFSKSKKEAPKKLEGWNLYYQQQMMMQCVSPLAHGINASSVLQTVGMYAGMCLFSPEFKKQCHSVVQTSLYSAVKARADKAGENSGWGKLKAKIEAKENGGYLPFSPKSAAVMQTGFLSHAFLAMRKPGADTEKILNQYQEAVSILEERAMRDGISKQALQENVRTLAGHLMEHDPLFSQMIAEFSDPKQPVSRGNGEVRKDGTKVWCGEFLTTEGKPYTGMFTPRKPQTLAGHMEGLSSLIFSDIKGCKNMDDVKKALWSDAHLEMRNQRFLMMAADGFSMDHPGVQRAIRFTMQQEISGWADMQRQGSQSVSAPPAAKKDSAWEMNGTAAKRTYAPYKRRREFVVDEDGVSVSEPDAEFAC